ncbi:hypothetical protein PGT21_027417 [Puccinia graminis f. sp. tritici]|uniref:Uncharacterized protein n=1 Tax=Puccinia graminis f. sp. tritici TaxID=56615 RepID=A0A5B0PLH9_PUCGR|nr:hypothetical protein PGT21_027417 [Puccinia graminis f. sp. tritici]
MTWPNEPVREVLNEDVAKRAFSRSLESPSNHFAHQWQWTSPQIGKLELHNQTRPAWPQPPTWTVVNVGILYNPSLTSLTDSSVDQLHFGRSLTKQFGRRITCKPVGA